MTKFLALVLALVASTASAQTVRTVQIQTVFVTYAGNTAHWTPDIVARGQQLLAQANGFWNGPHGSWGAITLTGTTWPTWVDSTGSMAGGCNVGQIGIDVHTATGTWGINGIRHIVLPPGTPCNSMTSGTVPGLVTVYTVAGTYEEHEIGHALGLPHAFATYPDGSTQAYGPYDVMGTGTYGDALHVAFRQQVGVYGPTFQLKSVTTSQDVVLQLTETMTPGIKGLTASKAGTTGHEMTAEFRGGDYLSTGVIIHGAPSGYLLTMDPTQQNYWRLLPGKTYCDPGYVCMTVVAQDALTATVHVDVNGSTDTRKPSRPVAARVS
jgi:hypothetical protein